MSVVRKLHRVRVFSAPLDGAHAFAERETQRLAERGRPDLSVEVMPTAQAAIEGADLICTVTSSRAPVLCGEWVSPGAHINAVGAFQPSTRELDTRAVAQARLYVDRREATLGEAGDFLIPKAEGAFGDEHIVAELGELLTGAASGRSASHEITLFKSLGLAIEDLAAAHHVLQKALQTDQGDWLELGGRRFGEA
jgi:ornithine cyclodeaminase